MGDRIFNQFKDYTDKVVARENILGLSIAVWHSHCSTASSLLNVGTGVEVTTDSVIQIGSINIVLTASLIMKLVEVGKIELDKPVREFRVADTKATNTITVCHLLTHAAGFDGDFYPNDANQGWSFEQLEQISPRLKAMDVAMPELPLPRGDNADLEGSTSPIPLAADESCPDRTELEPVSSGYQMVNIKLDKTGGLTEALELSKDAKEQGMALMVGNMGGTSLCITPAFVVGQLCRFVDLDGPLLFKHDRSQGVIYQQAKIQVPSNGLWGTKEAWNA